MKLTLINSERIQALSSALLDELQSLTGRIRAAWNVEHTESDGHADVTAYSLRLTKSVDQVQTGALIADGAGTLGGDVVALNGTGTECGIGKLLSVNGTALLSGETVRQGLLLGGIATGFFTEVRAAQAPMDANTVEQCTWNLKFSTTKPVWRLGIIFGVPTLIDGGGGATQISIGDLSRPIGTVVTNTLIANNGLLERNRSVAAGEWIDVPFNAANFTASAGSWTLTSGDQVLYRYTLVGKTMTIAFQFDSTTVTATPVLLKFALPGGYVVAQASLATCYYNESGTWIATGNATYNAGGTVINLQPGTLGVSSWSTTVNLTYVRGTIVLEIQ